MKLSLAQWKALAVMARGNQDYHYVRITTIKVLYRNGLIEREDWHSPLTEKGQQAAIGGH